MLWPQVAVREILTKYKEKENLLEEWWRAWTSCPKKLWNFYPWKLSKLTFIKPWSIKLWNYVALSRGVNQRTSQGSLADLNWLHGS